MPFKKGQSGNPGGRPEGATNKTTSKLREAITDILNDQGDKIKKALAELEREDKKAYLMVVEKFMSYVVPKKRDITSNDETITPSIIIEEVHKSEV
jgi:hypothetical protein